MTTALSHCHCCQAPISANLIEDLNQFKENVVCEGCGTELKRETVFDNVQIPTSRIDAIPPKEHVAKDIQKIQAFKRLNQKFRLFMFRYAYEIVKTPKFSKELRNGDRYLTEAQAKSLSYKLRKILRKNRFPDEWLKSTGVKQDYVEKYYDYTLKDLKIKKFYRQHYQNFFHETFQVVFQLITGIIRSTDFSGVRQRQILNDLKRTFCFVYNGTEREKDSFPYFVIIFVTRFIHELVQQHELFLEENRDNIDTLKAFIYRLANALALSVANLKFPAERLDETFTKPGRKLFDRKYKILQDDLLNDKLYYESFVDAMTHLIRKALSRNLGIILQLNKNLRNVFSLRKINSRLESSPNKIVDDITLTSKDNKQVTVKSTLDTGSEVCLIDADLLLKLGLSSDSKNRIVIKDLNKKQVAADRCSIYTRFEEIQGMVDFYVFEGLIDAVGTPVLVGMDLINGVIDEKGTYILGSKESCSLNNTPVKNCRKQDVFTIKTENNFLEKIKQIISAGEKTALSKLSDSLKASEDTIFKIILNYLSEIYQKKSNPRAHIVKKYNQHFGERIHTYEEFKRIIEYFDGELITTPNEYQELHKKTPPSRIRFKVNCIGGIHDPFHIRGNHLLAGVWCKTCFEEIKTFKYDDCVRIGKDCGYILITTRDEFEELRKHERPSHIKLKWRCRVANHEPFERSIVRLKTAYCKQCTGEKITRELITRWITSQIFKIKFHTTNIKELISKKIFQEVLNLGNYPLVNMRSYSRMHFDCYAEIEVNDNMYKLAVEFNGPQHYRFNPRFHKSLKHFRSSQQRDKMKIELCKTCDIILIVLPYKVKNKDFQDFIIKDFEKKTKENLGAIEQYDFHVLYRQNNSAQKSLDNF